MKFIAKKHYTFTELTDRWGCTENELKQAVIDGDLFASLHISAGSYSLIQFLTDHNHGGSVSRPTELRHFADEEGEMVLQQLDGFYYLICPRRTGASQCEFSFFSDRPVHRDQVDICFSLQKMMNLDDVFGLGIVMAQEVARVEAQNEDKPAPKSEDKPLARRERESLLRIIGGLLALLLDQRPVKANTSNQTEIINALVAAYGDKDGISERNLQGRFADANRALAQP